MVQDEKVVREIKLTTNETNVSSYKYKGDLWRYDLVSNQWEEVEVFGIATVKRQISLWNGTVIEIIVPSANKLKADLANIQIIK